MMIGLAYDLLPDVVAEDGGPDDRFEEYDRPGTIEALARVIAGLGHEVVLLGDGRPLLERVLADPPDFVLNLAEGQGIGRCREARVPAVLEMLGVPYSGSDPLTLAASLDKAVARMLVRAAGIAVPDATVLEPGAGRGEVEAAFAGLAGSRERPLIVKPLAEGSSKGIREGLSVIETAEEMVSAVLAIHRDHRQPALIEEFIEGDELTVGLLGNGGELEIVGVMRVAPRSPAPRFVYSLEVKRDWRQRVDYQVPASLSAGDLDALTSAATRAFRTLGCRDVARIDFRLRSGIAYFLEANPLPGLDPENSDLAILAGGAGLSYESLIERILHAALSRCGLV